MVHLILPPGSCLLILKLPTRLVYFPYSDYTRRTMVAQETITLKYQQWWRVPTDRTALFSLVVFALLLKIIILLQHPILARDGILHVHFAHDLMEHPWTSTLREHPFHPGYAFTIAVASLIFQVFDPGALAPSQWQWCAHLSSSLAGILLILPLYGLARCFYSIRTAWLGSLLFLALPWVVQTTTDALTESWYLLFMLAALWTLVQGVRSARSSWFVMTGLLTGAAYLVRVEAVLILAVAMLWSFVYRWQQSRPLPNWCAIRNMVILSACFLLPPLPYMMTIGKFSNRPVVQTLVQHTESQSSLIGSDHLLASHRLQDGVDGLRRETVRWSEALWLVVASMGNAGNYFLWPLAGIGFVILWRTRRDDPGYILLLCLCALQLAVLTRLALTAGYATERHSLLFVALAAQTAAIGLITLGQWIRQAMVHGRWGRQLTGILATALVILCLPKDVQPLHRSQEAHRQAGLWLAEHMQYNYDVLVDPYNWASFYAGLSFNPKRTNSDYGYTLGVIIPKDTDFNRQREWTTASLFCRRASIVWTWPEHGQPKLIIKKVQENGGGLGSTFSY